LQFQPFHIFPGAEPGQLPPSKLQRSAPEARQRVAHGGQPQVWSHKNHKPRQGRQIKPFVCFLSPLPGLELLRMIPPTVSPWATIFRRSATLKNAAQIIRAHFSGDSSGFKIHSGFFRTQTLLFLSGGDLIRRLVLP
jgi:hypothetical protein